MTLLRRHVFVQHFFHNEQHHYVILFGRFDNVWFLGIGATVLFVGDDFWFGCDCRWWFCFVAVGGFPVVVGEVLVAVRCVDCLGFLFWFAV